MDWKTSTRDMRADLRALNALLPETNRDFSALTKTAKAEGPLDAKTREFVALAIAIADRCEPCVAFHVEALKRAGGTRAELASVLAIAIQMGGGPSLMYAAKTLACWDELAGRHDAAA